MKTIKKSMQQIRYTLKEAFKLIEKEELPHECEFIFDKDTIFCDSIIQIRNGKLYLSSNIDGIVDYKKDQYIHFYHCLERKLGQLKYVLTPLEETK